MTSFIPIGGAETPLNLYAARDLGAHHGLATAVAWSCTAHRLASGGVDGVVKIWAPEKTRPNYNVNLQQQMMMMAATQQGQQQRPPTPTAPERPVAEVRLPPSVSASSSSSRAAGEHRGRPPRVARLAWHPRRADILAVASDDGATVRLFDARTGEAPRKSSPSSSSSPSLIASFTPPAPMPRCTAISLSWCPHPRHRNVVAVGTDADVISFHDVSAEGNGRVVALLPAPVPATEVNEAVFSADGTVFARAVGTSGAVELFSVEELLSNSSSSSETTTTAATATATTAATMAPKTPSEWKHARASAKPFATLKGHTSTVFALSSVANAAAADTGAPLGPAAHLLASGGADGAAVVWDLRFGGAPLAACGAFDSQVKSVSLGGGWSSSSSSSPPSSSSSSLGSMIAYAGEGDAVIVEDWARSARGGGFVPPRRPTAPHLNLPSPRPYTLRVFVPNVLSVAWAPAVVDVSPASESAPKSAAAAGTGSRSSLDQRPPSPRSTKLRGSSSSSSSALATQQNVGALAFTRCFTSSSSGQKSGSSSSSRSADNVGAIGLFAPPPPVSR